MPELINHGSLTIEPVMGEKEIRLKVSDSSGYLFTLEPSLDGFKQSAFDREMDIEVDPNLLSEIIDVIESYYA